MEAARRHRAGALQERNLLIGVLSRLWPSHLSPSATPQQDRVVVCVHSPAGQLAWHISQQEAVDTFAHLKTQPNDWDHHTTGEKIDRMAMIVESGIVTW